LTVILDAIRGTDIEEVEVEFGTELIRVRLAPELSPEHGEAAINDNRVADGPIEITADRVGTFFRTGKEETEPLVSPGDLVEAEDPIGYIDSLQIRYELLALGSGRIVSFVVSDGEDVEYGQLIATISDEALELK
jgi:biotin carboxyl carrier protein